MTRYLVAFAIFFVIFAAYGAWESYKHHQKGVKLSPELFLIILPAVFASIATGALILIPALFGR